jgi:hypothetical protein
MWPSGLSARLPIAGTVGHYPAVYLMGRGPIPSRQGFPGRPMRARRSIRYQPRFPAVVPVEGAGWPRVTHPFATVFAPEGALPVRLACVRRAASVHPEPGSNSPFGAPEGAPRLRSEMMRKKKLHGPSRPRPKGARRSGHAALRLVRLLRSIRFSGSSARRACRPRAPPTGVGARTYTTHPLPRRQGKVFRIAAFHISSTFQSAELGCFLDNIPGKRREKRARNHRTRFPLGQHRARLCSNLPRPHSASYRIRGYTRIPAVSDATWP